MITLLSRCPPSTPRRTQKHVSKLWRSLRELSSSLPGLTESSFSRPKMQLVHFWLKTYAEKDPEAVKDGVIFEFLFKYRP